MEVAQYNGRIASVLWKLFSTCRDNISTVEGYLQYCGWITVAHVGVSFSTVRDTFSTVEIVQYCGGCSVQWR